MSRQEIHPWELTFRWANRWTPRCWNLAVDAFLELVSFAGITIVGPGFPFPVVGVIFIGGLAMEIWGKHRAQSYN
jgi:hypothetical protein